MSSQSCVVRVIRWSLASLLSAVSACNPAVTPPPQDPMMQLLSSVERGRWGAISQHFSSEHPLADFPLKLALDGGASIDGVKRMRLMDRHLIFDVDVRSAREEGGGEGRGRDASDLKRFTFWFEVKQAERIASEPTPPMSIGELKGWLPGAAVREPLIKLSDINTPPRFSATSFRGVPELKSIAVFDADQLDLKGWSATMIKLEPELRPLKRRGCRKVNVRVSRPVLEKEIRSCSPLLAREAQRAHLLGAMTIRDDAAIHDQERGSFAGRLSLRLPLDFEPRMRPSPELVEAMIVGEEFTDCIQQKVSAWSRDYIPRAACELNLPMLFKVSMPLQAPFESLTEEPQAEGGAEPTP